MPKVSIILPVYNGEKYICETIRNILIQNFNGWELIVVDDGSTDQTENIVSAYFEFLTYIKQSNKGPSAARNCGLKKATGDYIAFIDADDLWDPSFLHTSAQVLDTCDEQIVGTCCGWEYIDSNGEELSHTRISNQGKFGILDLLKTNPFPIHAALIRKEAISAVEGFDEQIWALEDWDLWLRLTVDGKQFLSIPNCLAQYRIHGKTNSRHLDRMQFGRIKSLDKLFSRTDLSSNVLEFKSKVYGKALLQCGVEVFSAECADDAFNYFTKAIHDCPELLEDAETYYSIICAGQPIGYKASIHSLDLKAGEIRIRNLIGKSINRDNDNFKWYRLAFENAYLILGRLSYGQKQMGNARRYLIKALTNSPLLLFNINWITVFLKTYLRPGWIDTLRVMKSRITEPRP